MSSVDSSLTLTGSKFSSTKVLITAQTIWNTDSLSEHVWVAKRASIHDTVFVTLEERDPRSIFSKPRASTQSAVPPLTKLRAMKSAVEPVEQLLLTL